MAFSIDSKVEYQETYMLIDIEFLEEFDKQNSENASDDSELNDIDIENYMQELRNVGSNFNSEYSNTEIESMSQEELREMYEAEMLKEKYGDDYEKMMNTSYEDYLDESSTSDSNSESSDNQSDSSSESYAGPALVFVELDNPNRGNAFIDVPVFTCRDGGTVVINITIDSDGSVKSASVGNVSSSGDGTCISNAAKNSALRSRFTTLAGGKTESGKITYQFIQQ